MPSTHDHPRPALNRIIQTGALVVFLIMLASVPVMFYVAATVPLARLMVLAAVITFALSLPVLMLTTLYPPATISPDGLRVEPLIWPNQHLDWSAVTAIKTHPLLPPADSEMGRKLFVGRKKYQPAEGVMLIIPTLPFYYKVNGLFCGEGLTPVVAFTNRSHADYKKLAHKLNVYCDHAKQKPAKKPA